MSNNSGVLLRWYLWDAGHKSVLDVAGNLFSLPDAARSVDCAFCRHAIEYAASPEPAMSQLIRVSRAAVVLILGQVPGSQDELDDCGRSPPWNCWGVRRYEAFLSEHPRVVNWNWLAPIGADGVNGKPEAMLFVNLQ